MGKNFKKYGPYMITGNILLLHLAGYLAERLVAGGVSALVWLGVAIVDMFFGFKCGNLVCELFHADPLSGFQRDKSEVYRAIDKTMAESLTPRVTVIRLDIDRFEAVRRTYGHVAADSVLGEAMNIIRAAVPPEGIIVQWGWTELVVVLPNISAAAARTLAESLRGALVARSFAAGGETVKVTASLGVVTADGRFAAENILLLAEEALAAGRRQGDPVTSFAVNHI